jgi:hypothetical protein
MTLVSDRSDRGTYRVERRLYLDDHARFGDNQRLVRPTFWHGIWRDCYHPWRLS